MIDVFEAVKSSVDILDAAARFGVEVKPHNKALCFAHDEKPPSLSFKDNRFKCFGCGVGGSVIDMVAIIQEVAPLEAVKQLDAMYSLNLFKERHNMIDIRRKMQKSQADKDRLKAFEVWELKASIIWAEYCQMLEGWKIKYAPIAEGDEVNRQFAEACNNLDYADYIYSAVFINGGFEEKAQFYKTHKKEVEYIDQYIRKNK